MKTLSLTTPHMKGAEVKNLQSLLKKNSYGSFYHDKVDGEFGTYTATAIKLAKFALGYPENEILPYAADPLVSYLSGAKSLPILYKARRNSRLKKEASADKDFRLKALKSAISFIGTAESPSGSNRVMFSDWYGIVGPWCAMFVTYNMVAGGSKAFQKGNRWAYCPFVVDDARAGRNGVKQVSTANVQPGDIVLYDWNNDGVADHIGIFEGWTDKKKTKFTAIEGNTSGKNPSDGGEVARTTRDMKNVLIFAHPLY